MSQPPIRFEDGAAYDQAMGVWSTLAANIFLDWLAPQPNLRWLDIGCGTGAFTETVMRRCAPAEIHGVDPSEAQLAFARTRPGAAKAHFQQAGAMDLPFPDNSFDVAAMALVIFFVPDPAKGLAEMARVVRPNGLIAAYAWDMLGGGFPFNPIYTELQAQGVTPPSPPSVDASRAAALQTLWSEAGLQHIQSREITVQRSFPSFEDFWRISVGGGTVKTIVANLPGPQQDALKARVAARLPADPHGHITYSSRANAIQGRVPA